MAAKNKTCGARPGNHGAGGFTLVETVIYIGLFSVIASFVIVVFYQMIGDSAQNKDRIEVDTEANFMMHKLVWALTGTQAVNQPALNSSSSVLSLTRYNYGQNPVVFGLGSRNLTISEGGAGAVTLGSGRVYVSRLVFEHLPAVQSAPEAVKIILEVASTDITRPAASTTMENTIYIWK